MTSLRNLLKRYERARNLSAQPIDLPSNRHPPLTHSADQTAHGGRKEREIGRVEGPDGGEAIEEGG